MQQDAADAQAIQRHHVFSRAQALAERMGQKLGSQYYSRIRRVLSRQETQELLVSSTFTDESLSEILLAQVIALSPAETPVE